MTNFQTLAFRKKKTREKETKEHQQQLTVSEGESNTADINIKLATLTRKKWITVSSVFFTISVFFLILVIIGNTSNRRFIRSIYFLKLNLANIIPASTPGDIIFVNSLARSLGLHDFYQVGIWNFCEGYTNEGVTFCSKPKSRYWFNPVEILLQELLSGATIALPADINKILDLVKLASSVLFCFFIAGACMTFVSIFAASTTLYSRWWSLPFVIWTFFATLFTTVATVIVTAMSIIFVNVATSQPGIKLSATIGKPFFIFMWIATAFSVLGLLIHLCLLCCFASRRDIITGRKKGNNKAYDNVVTSEKRILPPPPYVKKWLEKVPNLRNKRTVEVA